MRIPLLLIAICLTLNAEAQAPAAKLWNDLKLKRAALLGLHEEFEINQTFVLPSGNRSSQRTEIIDVAQEKWRQGSASGSGDRIRIFDGKNLFLTEDGSNEYVRIKRNPKDPDPEPAPFVSTNEDWSKAAEKGRVPCGIAGNNKTCVVIDVPLKTWVKSDGNSQFTRMTEGVSRFVFDIETGLLVRFESQQAIETPHMAYVYQTTYSVKRVSYDSALDASLFKLPEDGLHEVKELSPWDAPRMKKHLVGKPAPDLQVTDIHGKPVSLSDLKGKTVLLDFWTSWCPPCREDAPSLEKLYQKYGQKDLMIVGISVSEDRQVVENYLKKQVHSYPVVLTTENEMPRPYEIGIFPTYIVISPDGTITSAMQGDQGFGELRKDLKKAGMDTD